MWPGAAAAARSTACSPCTTGRRTSTGTRCRSGSLSSGTSAAATTSSARTKAHLTRPLPKSSCAPGGASRSGRITPSSSTATLKKSCSWRSTSAAQTARCRRTINFTASTAGQIVLCSAWGATRAGRSFISSTGTSGSCASTATRRPRPRASHCRNRQGWTRPSRLPTG